MGGANGSREWAPDNKRRDTHPLHVVEVMGFREELKPSCGLLSFRDAPLGAGPESILPVVVMDSGLARSLSSGRALRGPVGAPRNDGVNFRKR
jgi:hypothetical protein